MKKDMWVAILMILALVAAGLACANGETRIREKEDPTPDSDAVAAAVEEIIAALTPEPTAEQPTPTETNTPTPTNTPTASPTAAPGLKGQMPPRGDYQHGYEITEEYNISDEQTEVIMEFPIEELKRSRLYLMAMYFYDGTDPKPPIMVSIGWISINDSWEYRDCRDVKLLLDDDVLLEPLIEPKYRGEEKGGVVVEMVNALFSLYDFLQIVNANKVEGRLCNDELVLTESDMEALRDFASRMQREDAAPSRSEDDVAMGHKRGAPPIRIF